MKYNHQAIRKAYPDAWLLIEDDIGITDMSTKEQFVVDQTLVDAAAAELAAEAAATAYQRNRQPEYPPITDLADALYWSNQGDNSKLDAYYAACAAVKAKYPKPEVTQ